MMETRVARLWRLATTDGVPSSSLRIAIVVGAILNLINQGDALLGGTHVNWAKVVLTFFVPYGVSTYGAVGARLRAERRRCG
jgi:hypothetical protein